MKLPGCLAAVICVSAIELSGCATPPSSEDQLHGEVHTELTPYREDLLQRPAPAYPAGPRGQKDQGIGVFRIRFDVESGQAIAVKVVNSTGHFGLDQAALDALRNWTIKPRTWHDIDVLIRFATADSAGNRTSSGRRQFPVGAPASFRPAHSRPP
jgi:TonB family C-terminal domain